VEAAVTEEAEREETQMNPDEIADTLNRHQHLGQTDWGIDIEANGIKITNGEDWLAEEDARKIAEELVAKEKGKGKK
jgi:hypothetical protein